MFPYDNTATPPCPAVVLRITNNLTGLQIGPFTAVIDTGSDVTCVPAHVAEGSGAVLVPQRIGYADGREEEVSAVEFLDAKIEFIDINGNLIKEQDYEGLTVLVIKEGLLGRDLLNRYRCEFDGPGQMCMINW
jgi:hypothetical protein